MQIENDEPEIMERVAALDVGKAEVVVCVRLPGPGGRRLQEVRTVTTMTAALLALGDRPAGLGVRLPADWCTPGARPAQAASCAAEGNRDMSPPVSARIT
jgi:hypothetical protein